MNIHKIIVRAVCAHTASGRQLCLGATGPGQGAARPGPTWQLPSATRESPDLARELPDKFDGGLVRHRVGFTGDLFWTLSRPYKNPIKPYNNFIKPYKTLIQTLKKPYEKPQGGKA